MFQDLNHDFASQNFELQGLNHEPLSKNLKFQRQNHDFANKNLKRFAQISCKLSSEELFYKRYCLEYEQTMSDRHATLHFLFW